jgi:hypothetical protein
MSLLKFAFNSMLAIHNRTMTLKRLGAGGYSITVKATPSNYFRNLETAGDVIAEGREFIISKSQIVGTAVDRIKRGDRLADSELGEMTIVEAREMFDLGGEVMGYRLRIG